MLPKFWSGFLAKPHYRLDPAGSFGSKVKRVQVVCPLDRSRIHVNRRNMRSCSQPFLLIILAAGIASSAVAQDTRTVVEPSIPPACITLKPKIAAPRGVIKPGDEQRLDTGRIQDALDHCAQGKSVVLQEEKRNNVFLSGPLQLRTGVTLVVAAGTALVASRDPRLYDLSPGS